jgi:hypothetical protein
MDIQEAYCEELGQTINIYAARREFFEMAESSRKRFVFRCSDEACRAANNPLVVAVNYDKVAEETDIVQQPHFKGHKLHPHIEQCIWHQGVGAKSVSIPVPDIAKPSVAKQSSWIQKFLPPTADRESETTKVTASTSTTSNAPELLKNRRQPTDEPRERSGISSTKELEKIVNNWLAMTGDARYETQLEIGQQTVRYSQFFRQLESLEEQNNGERIIYGSATPILHPQHDPEVIYLNFLGALTKFPSVGQKGQKLTIALDVDRLRRHRRSGHFLERIKQSQRLEYYLRVFAFGKITPYRENGYRLEVAALDNLVLLAAKKSKK